MSVNKALSLKLSFFVKRQQLLRAGIKEVITNESSTFFLDNNNQYWTYQILPVLLSFPHNIKEVILGSGYSFFLDINGNVWMCRYGDKYYDGYRGNGVTPIQLKTLIHINQIMIGTHNFFLDMNGNVWVCGDDNYRLIEDCNEITYSERPDRRYINSPVQVLSLMTIEKMYSFCGDNSHFDKSDKNCFFLNNIGQVWALGSNVYGQLGINNNEEYCPQPIRIAPLGDIKDIFNKDGSTFFLNTMGQVWACGCNEYGQLGIGNNQNQYSPTFVTIPNAIKQIFIAHGSTFFLDIMDQVWACGLNDYGQLGIGNNENQYLPILVVLPSNIKQIFILSYKIKEYKIYLVPSFPGNLDAYKGGFLLHNNALTYIGNGIFNVTRTPIVKISNFNKFIEGINEITKDRNNNEIVQIRLLDGEHDALIALMEEDKNFISIYDFNYPSLFRTSSTFFLGNDGDIWACGYNGAGQLGIGSNTHVNLPIRINTLKEIKEVTHHLAQDRSLYSYWGYSYIAGPLFLDQCGKVWICGREYQNFPTQVPIMSNIKQLINGNFLLDEHDQVWTQSRNECGQLELGHSQYQNEFTKIKTFYNQKKKIMQKFDVETLAQLVCDQRGYSEACFEVLLEKLSKETITMRRECFNLIKDTPWYQPMAAQLLLKNLASLGQEANFSWPLESRQQEAILVVKQLMPQILILPEGLLLIDLVKAYNNEETSPYGFIRQTKTFFGACYYSNTDAWAEIIRLIKTNLKILMGESEITLTWRQYQDYNTIIKTDTTRTFSFDFFQPEEDFEYEGHIIYSEEEISQGLCKPAN